MLDFIKKTMLTGIGIAMKTKDELEEWVREIVKKGEMSENEGKDFLESVKKKSKEAQKEFEEKIESKFKDLLKKADIATRDDVSALKNEIEELKKTLGSK
jgi:polyhydroxyalkanoate synthesis regulator phasin